ncbi:hypothetical protein [Streptomyces sp. cmx-10-25]|uniref:hypothetical protein n=1 Tax=Streptomyces sp. cmx-10-25 TaxID=2790919 RepID=UPI00398100C3
MSELMPVDGEGTPEAQALARALRDLFAGLNTSLRRYAVRRAYDSATVSRYLGGRRLPPWKFVLDLLHDVAEERDTPPTEQTVAMLRALHTAALESGGGATHKVQLLERRLADADREARRAVARMRLLEEALEDREHRIRDLQLRERELRAGIGSPLSGDAGGAPSSGEYARLREEIQDLTEELDRVRDLHRQAEERCERLEQRLAEAEAEAERGAGAETGALESREIEVVESTGAPVDFLRGEDPSYRIGHINGNVNFFTDGWRVDEEVVASVSVQVSLKDFQVGNGLLLDARRVLVAGWASSDDELPYWLKHELHVLVAGSTARTELEEVRLVRDGSHTRTWVPFLALLRLSEPVPVLHGHPALDHRPALNSRLLVNAHVRHKRYSCLLEMKGRSGDWLRVSGEMDGSLVGAPVFSGAGGLVGLLLPQNQERGLVLPASALGLAETADLDQ